MNNSYDVHAWSTQYRQERLSEAWTRHLEGHMREDRKARFGQGSVDLAVASVLSLVRGA